MTAIHIIDTMYNETYTTYAIDKVVVTVTSTRARISTGKGSKGKGKYVHIYTRVRVYVYGNPCAAFMTS